MKTAVASTSIDCYHAIHGEGKLTRMQAAILSHMRAGNDYSLQELVRITGLAINTVSGRCNELRTAKRLEHGATRACSVTGRTVHPVKLPAVQLEIF